MCPPACPYADFSLTWKLLSLLFMSGAQCPVCELPTWNSEDLFYELNDHAALAVTLSSLTRFLGILYMT